MPKSMRNEPVASALPLTFLTGPPEGPPMQARPLNGTGTTEQEKAEHKDASVHYQVA